MIAVVAARADETELAAVQVAPGQSLRDLAQYYLGDPDLWPTVLALNGLDLATELQPGMELLLPIEQLARANRSLQAALETIQAATREGARLFAATAIGDAIELHEQAVLRRAAADYDGATALADQAGVAAAQALSTAQAARDVAAEALLSDRQGWVEGQRPRELLWSDRAKDTVLIEEEKLRTLSRSTAQITFRDDSRLRLNANSHAVIQRLRIDPLSRREDAKVSLIEGDFYALLGGRSSRKNFEVEIADVDSDIRSTSFWVSNNAEGAKFTNYDDRVLTIAAQGESVTLGRNEGAVVRSGQPPEDKAGLLGAPGLLAPADAGVVVTPAVTLRWQAVDDAAGYWLEVAFDPDYRRMTFSRWALATPDYVTDELAPGVYYWRVAALDEYGLPGSRSASRQLRVAPDLTPPFLTIERPAEGDILRDASLRLEGRAEPGVRLTLDGRPVASAAAEGDSEGVFALPYAPQEGANVVTIEAVDAAGNVTRRSRSFVFMPDAGATLSFAEAIPRRDERHFITAGDEITLAGTTTPAARLAVRRGEALVAATHADAAGAFRLNLPVAGQDQQFAVAITAPSGFVSEDGFAASVDRAAPVVTLDAPPPPVTALGTVSLSGQLDEDASLTLNGQPLPVTDRRFATVMALDAERNPIALAATDLVGNVRVAKWEVRLDQTPPDLLAHRIAADAGAGAPAYMVEVEAQDPAGMLQAAPFTLAVAGRAQNGFLNLDAASGRYRAKVVLDRPAGGAVRLQDVVLEDYAGNRRRYVIE